MGNRHIEAIRESRPINPSDSPFIDLLLFKLEGDVALYRYVPVWKNPVIWAYGGDNAYPTGDSVTLPALPEYERIPLAPDRLDIDPRVLMEATISLNLDKIIEVIIRAHQEGASGLACKHGTHWGLLPERMLSAVVSDIYPDIKNPDTGFPEVGGRKRDKTHLIPFGR